MSKRPTRDINLPLVTHRYLLLPAVITGGIVFFLLFLHGILSGEITAAGRINLIIGFIGMLFLSGFVILSRMQFTQKPVWNWAIAILSGVFLAYLKLNEGILLPGATLSIGLIFIIILSLTAGRWPTYLFALILTMINIFSLWSGIPSNGSISSVSTGLIVIMAIVINETLFRLRQSLLLEMNRLETLNRVARSLASSLDMPQVVGLINSAIQKAFDADTYYVGLLQGDTLHMELFYDDGEFFPNMDIPIKNTLAGIVLSTKKSLLITDLVAERKKRNLPFMIVGRPRASSSWLGTPLEINGCSAGLIAVGSYEKHAFDKGDMNLLENIAQQASLALNNAGRHGEVKTRSQQDSLTNVLNHNAFLARLERQVHEAEEMKTPLSLIMLDVDGFKHYNDQYGHLIGDEILTTICQIIRRNIKKCDIVGRWGGEEFVISLPETTVIEAYQVANRIRNLIENTTTVDRNGQTIRFPTVSQGIAEYREDIGDYIRLVDIADQLLYVAKNRGKNEIEPCIDELAEVDGAEITAQR